MPKAKPPKTKPAIGLDRIQHRLIEVLKREFGYRVTDDLVNRVEHFVECIEPDPNPKRIEKILQWLGELRSKSKMEVDTIPMSEVERWRIDPATGAISHETGEFFQVIGIRVRHGDDRENANWCQPILYQKEMGILGIIRKKLKGRWHYLLQAKAEPGNLHKLQISPTLQATVSNLRRAHGGFKPLFADSFENPRPGSVFYATYQTEDGGRLHLKTNLNMIVEVGPDEFNELPANFRWFTMSEIKQLLKHENTVNLHIRSIISPL